MRLADLYRPLQAFLLASLMILGAGVASAQSVDTAGLEVDVKDPSGALVSGATLTLTQTATHDVRTGVTNAKGEYRFVELPVGPYELTIQHAGFAETHQTGLTLSVGQASTLNIALTVANADAVVQVNGDVSQIDPDRTTIGQTISQQEIDDLPSNGRNFLDFVTTVPEVTVTQTTGQNSGFSVNGQRSRSNSVMIDGVENNGQLNGNVRQTLSQDAIAQFTVLTEQFPAEFGGAGGGFVNVVTKAGTDNIHGTVYYFARTDDMSWTNPLVNTPQGSFSRNDVGASLGGPIKQNRTYFFGAAEYIGSNTSRFSYFCHTGAVTPIYSSCSSTYDTVSNTLAKGALIGSPVKGLDFDEFIPQSNAQGLYSLRIDHRINDRNTLIARAIYVQYIQANNVNAGSVYDFSTATGTYTHTQNYFAEWTHIFSPTVLNELHVMVAPQRLKQMSNSYGTGADIAGSVLVGPTGDFPVTLDEDHYEADDDITKTLGNHLFKAGVQVNYIRAHSNFQTDFTGYWNFYSAGNFSSGIPYQFIQSFGNSDIRLPDTLIGAYLEDSWKVLPRLTANLGVRYDVDIAPQGFNQDNSDPIQRMLSKGMARDYNNFAPRIGLSYSLDGKGKTVLRAGYGMFYDKNLLILARNTLQTKAQLIMTYNTSNLANLEAQFVSGPYPRSNAYPTGTGVAPSISRAYPGLVLPIIHQADLGIDRAITSKLVLSVTGIHVEGEKLLKASNANLAPPVIMTTANQQNFGYHAYVPGAAPCTSVNSSISRSTCQPVYQMYNRPSYLNMVDPTSGSIIRNSRLNTAYNDISVTGPWGHSNYNGLRVALQQQSWHGLTVRAGYVWSRAEDDAPDFLNGALPDNPYNPGAEKSLSNEDVRNRFTGVMVYRVPNPFRKGWKKQVIGGWTFSGTFDNHSGTPENVSIGSDINFDDSSTDRPFVNGRIIGRNTFRGARYSYATVRGQKEFRFRHGDRLDLSAEAFDVTNRFNVTDFQTVWGTAQAPEASFGAETVPTSGRVMQVGAKLYF